LPSDLRERGEFLPASNDTESTDPNHQLLLCIEKGLNHYGASIAQVVFWNFETKTGLEKKDISKNPEKFVSSIEAMFAGGAMAVERTVICELRSGLVRCQLDDRSLVTALKQARAFLQRNTDSGR